MPRVEDRTKSTVRRIQSWNTQTRRGLQRNSRARHRRNIGRSWKTYSRDRSRKLGKLDKEMSPSVDGPRELPDKSASSEDGCDIEGKEGSSKNGKNKNEEKQSSPKNIKL